MSKLTDRKRSLGAWGENQAVQNLLSQGYTIIERNWRSRHGEIDIIAWSPEGTICFIEVRTSASTTFGGAIASLSPRKCQRLASTAREYMARHGIQAPARFDLVALQRRAGVWVCEHIRNAFEVT